MSSPVDERRSPFLRLMDAFLQEENIKWVLGLGVCILLGSSLRLVTLHWVEYTPVWKYLILVAYSVTIFALGEFSYLRLGLRKTGTVLKALTVLLIPISFLALHWVQPREDDSAIQGLQHVGMLSLLGVNLLWSAIASWRIFGHFLRRPQPTFFACYLILCIAGAVVPGLPAAWSLGVVLFLWAVFTVGTVKVNRHVFWLTEEHQLPRVFGFFPILLLGAQFAAVYLLGIAGNVTPAWMGLLCTLVALPVLMTADTVGRVFEQRHGGLVRPIPWSISGPLALGTMLSAAGVVLALTCFPASPAIVPTSVIAAVAMGIVAQRTQKKAFVWGMLFCIAVAYQTSPVFFKELVLQLRDQAAAAVRESRLPYAFYGLTYAPLILVFTGIATWLRGRGNRLFAGPLQTAATTLPCLLLAVAFTHPTAIFPVALLLCPLFVVQAMLFRNQRYLFPAAVAFLAAAYGGPMFARSVWMWRVSLEQSLVIWTAAASFLLLPGAYLDRFVGAMSRHKEELTPTKTPSICQLFSFGGSIAAASIWIVLFGLPISTGASGTGWFSATIISLLLASHSLRWLKTGLGEVTLVFATYVIFLHFSPDKVDLLGDFRGLCWLLLGQWMLSSLLARFDQTRIAKAFGPAAFRVSSSGLAVLSGLLFLIWMLQHFRDAPSLPLTSVAVLAWGLDASRRLKSWQLATVAWTAVFVFVTATLTTLIGTDLAQPWWMTAWTITGLALLGLKRYLSPSNSYKLTSSSGEEIEELHPVESASPTATLLLPLEYMLPLLFLAIGVFSLAFLGWPHRIAGVLALCSLLLTSKSRLPVNLSNIFLPLVNWQLLAACVTACSGFTGSVLQLSATDWLQWNFKVAAIAGISLWAFEFRPLRRRITVQELLDAHQSSLLMFAGWLLYVALPWNGHQSWTGFDIASMSVAWFAIVGTSITRAIRSQEASWVWYAQATALTALGYAQVTGLVDVRQPGIEFVLLLGGIAIWCIGHWVPSASRFAVVASPFQQSGFWLPLAVLPLALWRQFGPFDVAWAGANSLPLLGASAFYFWRAIERQQLGIGILSAVLLNTACALLWTDLHWTDPQLFLIPLGVSVLLLTELMSHEIPVRYHDRLRLVGSLMILVSPTFNIVTGSWLHILTLMVASSLLALVAIGVRVRMLLYTSTAFLLADLVALVARGSVDEPNILWIAGVALGAMIIALGAVCENHRETIMARLRYLSAELEQWA
ncbi:MAG TPA: hypothetical protein VGM98_13930 [Schlesneria sp.]